MKEEIKNPGAIPDRPDPRDYKWEEVGAGISGFDWNKGYDVEVEIGKAIGKTDFKMPVKDQNGSGSCGGQAMAYFGQAVEALATGSFEERSAKFVYAQTFIPFPEGGSSMRDNCAIVVNQGWGLEADTPSYDKGNPPTEAFMQRPQDITTQARVNAKSAKAKAYVNIEVLFDKIAQAVATNGGAIVGVTGSNNGTWLSLYPLHPVEAELTWRHWVYIGKAKLIGGKKYLGIINSMGAKAGDNGWQWISEDYVPFMWNPWTLVYNKEGVPAGFSHDFKYDLVFGERNSEVVALQKALQQDGQFPVSVPASGYFGDITRSAVLDFQIKHKVDDLASLYALNGRRVGPKTRAILNSLFA